MSLLRLRARALGYPGAVVLEDVDLEIAPGSFTGVLGGNGSGKTTLLRTLLGALPPLAGERRPAAGLRLGYVPQSVQLDPLFPLSAREVVTLGLFRGRALFLPLGARARAEVEASLERVGLRHRAHSLFRNLSGGQKQRVLVARALAGRPDLLLLDEPTSGVDPAAARLLLRVLEEARDAGTAVILVTHQPQVLAGLADRAWILREGRVRVREGVRELGPHELLEDLL